MSTSTAGAPAGSASQESGFARRRARGRRRRAAAAGRTLRRWCGRERSRRPQGSRHPPALARRAARPADTARRPRETGSLHMHIRQHRRYTLPEHDQRGRSRGGRLDADGDAEAPAAVRRRAADPARGPAGLRRRLRRCPGGAGQRARGHAGGARRPARPARRQRRSSRPGWGARSAPPSSTCPTATPPCSRWPISRSSPPDEYRTVLDAYRQHASPIVSVRYGEVMAPPHLFEREFFPELARLQHGARDLLRHHRSAPRSSVSAPTCWWTSTRPTTTSCATSRLSSGR